MVRIQHPARNGFSHVEAARQFRLADLDFANRPVEGKLANDPQGNRHKLLSALEAGRLPHGRLIGHAKSDTAAETVYGFLHSFVCVGPIRMGRGEVGKADEKPLVFITRSEEHTSELQSLTTLVLRLLLEKKTNQ